MRYIKLKLSFKERLIFLFTGLLRESVIPNINPITVKKDNMHEYKFSEEKAISESSPRIAEDDVKLEMPSLFSSTSKKPIRKTNLRD